MLEIINWLMGLEQMAKDVYSRASDYLKEDKELNSFLTRIAEEEAGHYHLMVRAAEHLREFPSETPVISLDEETRHKIEGVLTAISERMDSNSLTKDFMLEAIANAEFSEWNHIFLYVVNTMKLSVKDFMHVATRIQQHKRAIEYFYENIEGGHNKIKKLKSVASVWQENILVVDDSEVICKLIKAILDDEGNIDTAFNGKEGLDKLSNKYYRLIISDVDMPIMDGLHFFTEASAFSPDINSRFLFISGDISSERKTFFNKHNLSYLEKPAPIKEIRNKAMQIILSSQKKNESPV